MSLAKFRRPNPLSRLGLFAECSTGDVVRAAALLTAVTVPAGTVLLREGRPGRQFLLIEEGSATVTRTVDGAPSTVATLGPGDFAGELSLLSPGLASATVIAISPVTLYAGNPAEFASLLDVAPTVAERIRAAAETRTAANAG